MFGVEYNVLWKLKIFKAYVKIHMGLDLFSKIVLKCLLNEQTKILLFSSI